MEAVVPVQISWGSPSPWMLEKKIHLSNEWNRASAPRLLDGHRPDAECIGCIGRLSRKQRYARKTSHGTTTHNHKVRAHSLVVDQRLNPASNPTQRCDEKRRSTVTELNASFVGLGGIDGESKDAPTQNERRGIPRPG